MKDFTNNKYLRELLALCGVEHVNTLETIVAATQRQWLLAKSELPPEGTTYPLHEQGRIKELAQQLGFIDEISPSLTSYNFAILLGGETLTMEPRFDYVQRLCQRGLNFGNLIFHSGIHPMPHHDRYYGYTEAEVVRLLHKSSGLAEKFPSPHFVDIPLQKTSNGPQNPTTADGVAHWLSCNPQPASYLVISSQPYVHYQRAVFSNLPSSFSVEVVGSVCAESLETSIILDSITRHLYSCLTQRA